ncbi:hypothetical protein PYCCODRAFT_1437211 [Trametes coccinea BRFM310]|uniref:Protein kinase domain-containing protein n=1 Tax=Trametes coccinea (strain BRFM310) TaxID=1353009 RepID=A0A1Y2IJ11_TRAC3|nr:hypothetical protein PYCCODRAFT_1437211 [Trametes coccinea BRFM310]
MDSDLDGPPWFARHPDGTIHLGGVPERLQRHRKLKERGIALADSLKPGIVFGTGADETNMVVVKVLDLATEELPIYQRLLRRLDDPANHTVPAEIETSEHPLLIMPMLERSFNIVTVCCHSQTELLRVFYELVEGIDFMHQSHIVHMDFCCSNVLVAVPREGFLHDKVTPNRVYIIDFDTSRQFDLGPGDQHAVELPETQVDPPNEMTRFDPYSWDVYCLGRVLEWLVEDYCEMRGRIPRIAQWYARWLIGDEKGCRAVCHCRPTARMARVALAMIRLMGPLIDFYDTMSSNLGKRHIS